MQHVADRVAGFVGEGRVDVGDGGVEVRSVAHVEEQPRVPPGCDRSAADPLNPHSFVNEGHLLGGEGRPGRLVFGHTLQGSGDGPEEREVGCGFARHATRSSRQGRGDRLTLGGEVAQLPEERRVGLDQRIREGAGHTARIALLRVKDGVVAQLGP